MGTALQAVRYLHGRAGQRLLEVQPREQAAWHAEIALRCRQLAYTHAVKFLCAPIGVPLSTTLHRMSRWGVAVLPFSEAPHCLAPTGCPASRTVAMTPIRRGLQPALPLGLEGFPWELPPSTFQSSSRAPMQQTKT